MNQSLIEKMSNLLEETIEYYGENPFERRALKGEACYYYIKKLKDLPKRKCAVGRCLKHPKKFQKMVDEKFDGLVSFDILVRENLTPEFKEEYQGIPDGFWSDLQDLHDQNLFWNTHPSGKGLSFTGRRRAQEIRDKFNLPQPE